MSAKLSDLLAATALVGGELIYVAQGGNSRYSTLGAIGAQLLGDTGQTAALTTLGGPDNIRNFLDVPTYTSTRTVLKDLDTNKDTLAFMTEAGRAGIFKWTLGNFFAEIEADTAEGIYIKANDIASTVGAWVRVHNGTIDPRWFGAVGDGATDDNAAMSAAVVPELPIDGAGLTYATDGNIDLGAIFDLKNMEIKQLDPGQTNRRTLTSSNCLNGRLTNVVVDRNGDGTFAGGVIPAIDDADQGIRIVCATDGMVFIDGCEVKGNGFGRGIAVFDAAGGYIKNCWIHNMKAGSPTYTAITDDVVEGIRAQNVSGFEVSDNRINTLSTVYTGHAEWARFTRGTAVSGGAGSGGLLIKHNAINSVDQAIDISGDLNPRRINVEGNKINDALTWGVKCANSVREVVISGNNITRCGTAAVVVSAPTSSIAVSGVTTAECSGAVTITQNIIREIGDNNVTLASDISGILVLTNHADYAGYPRDIRIFNNDIEGNGAMLYGIKSDVAYSSGPGIVENNNRIETYTTSRVLAVQYDNVNVYNSANFSVPNNAITAVEFTAEDDDNSSMIAVTASTITIQRTGWYNLEANVFWAGNATGERQLFLYKGASAIARARTVVSSPSANDFTQSIKRDRLFFTAGDTVSLRAHQNSGGALNIRFEYTWFTVMRVY